MDRSIDTAGRNCESLIVTRKLLCDASREGDVV